MFSRIRTYIRKRQTEKQLVKVLRLLYSHTRFEAEELNLVLNPKDEIEAIENYIIIKVAAELQSPHNEIDIEEIWKEEVKAFESYVSSKEERDVIKELVKLKAHSSMLTFNLHMDMLRQTMEFNKYSLGGICLSMMIAKGRTLTTKESDEAEQHYRKIKETTELADAKLKEWNDLADKRS